MTAPPPRDTYQGYPYINPLVLDAPSLDAATAARWANLPRNPLVPDTRRQRESPDVAGSATSSRERRLRRCNRRAARWANLPRNPLVPRRQRESPDVAGSDTSSGETNTINRTNTEEEKLDIDEELDHRVYIDFPTNELGECVDNDRREENTREDTRSSRSDEISTSFVEDTIFYDPFEDRRIKYVGQSTVTNAGNGTVGPSGVPSPSTQAGSSSLDPTSPGPNRLPPYMTKESNIYGSPQSIDDRFTSSVPEQEFPEPPPAYTATDTTTVQAAPPRTVVIVPETSNPTGLASPDRKLVRCTFCGVSVYTLAIKENGVFTHLLAAIFIIVFAPLVIVVYCTDYFKYRNHYCPNCSKLIGYEIPMLCQDMVYI